MNMYDSDKDRLYFKNVYSILHIIKYKVWNIKFLDRNIIIWFTNIYQKSNTYIQ